MVSQGVVRDPWEGHYFLHSGSRLRSDFRRVGRSGAGSLLSRLCLTPWMLYNPDVVRLHFTELLRLLSSLEF